jgi:hypothetical protein
VAPDLLAAVHALGVLLLPGAARALFSTLEDEDWGHLYLTMGAFDEVRSVVQKL